MTGATGFVGRHLVQELLSHNYHVTVVSRDLASAKKMPWFNRVVFLSRDIYKEAIFSDENPPDVLIHLAWSGLPNFQGSFHITENLPNEINFLRSVIDAGVTRLIVAGTCLEYGMQHGPLIEESETKPSTPYGLAKDTIRKSLELIQADHSFNLQWARLFYMYGEGQNPKSLLSQLDAAIDSQQEIFHMSKGDQLRDYLYIGDVAKRFLYLVEHPEISGVINFCSGVPRAVHDLVLEHCKKRGASIQLNRGFYPYPEYEPMAFWGVTKKLDQFTN